MNLATRWMESRRWLLARYPHVATSWTLRVAPFWLLVTLTAFILGVRWPIRLPWVPDFDRLSAAAFAIAGVIMVGQTSIILGRQLLSPGPAVRTAPWHAAVDHMVLSLLPILTAMATAFGLHLNLMRMASQQDYITASVEFALVLSDLSRCPKRWTSVDQGLAEIDLCRVESGRVSLCMPPDSLSACDLDPPPNQVDSPDYGYFVLRADWRRRLDTADRQGGDLIRVVQQRPWYREMLARPRDAAEPADYMRAFGILADHEAFDAGEAVSNRFKVFLWASVFIVLEALRHVIRVRSFWQSVLFLAGVPAVALELWQRASAGAAESITAVSSTDQRWMIGLGAISVLAMLTSVARRRQGRLDGVARGFLYPALWLGVGWIAAALPDHPYTSSLLALLYTAVTGTLAHLLLERVSLLPKES